MEKDPVDIFNGEDQDPEEDIFAESNPDEGDTDPDEDKDPKDDADPKDDDKDDKDDEIDLEKETDPEKIKKYAKKLEEQSQQHIQDKESQAKSTKAPNTPNTCLLYTSPSPRDRTRSRMPSSA